MTEGRKKFLWKTDAQQYLTSLSLNCTELLFYALNVIFAPQSQSIRLTDTNSSNTPSRMSAEWAQTEEDIITPSHVYPQIKRWRTLEYKMLFTVNRTAALIQAAKRDASVSSKSDIQPFFFLNHNSIIWDGQRVYKRRGKTLLRSNNKHNSSIRTTALSKVHEGLILFILDWKYLKISVCWCITKWVIIEA